MPCSSTWIAQHTGFVGSALYLDEQPWLGIHPLVKIRVEFTQCVPLIVALILAFLSGWRIASLSTYSKAFQKGFIFAHSLC